LLFSTFPPCNHDMSVDITRLSVEHHRTALGVGETAPRLSWRFEGSARDWYQQAYDIRRVDDDGGEIETVHVDSGESVLVPWPFAPLGSRSRTRVKVQAHGKSVSTGWSSVLEVEGGLLDRSDWQAQVVTCEQQPFDKAKRPFRLLSAFHVPDNAQRARLYVTALGAYEIYVNGKRVGDEVLAPGWTQYNTQLVYRTHDISAHLRPGENWIGAWVGEGWYAGRLGFGGGRRNIWGSRPALLAQLEVDGKVIARTDESWRWKYGSLLESSIYDGEICDTGIEDDWKWDDSWNPVETLDFPDVLPCATQSPPIREIQNIKPVEIITTPSGKIIVDFGQNFGGYAELLGTPPSAGTIELTHFEVLEHGEVNMRPLRTAKCRDVVYNRGSWKGYKPKFTFHGFRWVGSSPEVHRMTSRYVHVNGWNDIKADDIVGIVVSTDMERVGHFSSSHKLLNRLHENVVWSTIANCISLPTDCPQRDERLGWTGDVQVFAPTLSFLFDGTGMLDGWLKDLAYEQSVAKGVVPIVVPSVDDHFNLPSAVWGDVVALLPAVLHRFTGDARILANMYAPMVDWLERGVKRDPATQLWDPRDMQFGDWLAPQVEGSNGITDPHLVADAYLVHVTRVVAHVAGLLGYRDDQQRFEAEAEALLAVFQDTYITARHRTVSDTQAAIALILHFDLIHPDQPEQRQVLVQRLEKLVTKCLWQVATGFAGTPIILHVLAENGLLHHAYRMLQAKDSPSWLSPVLLGATTIWERWDSMLQDGSINPDDMVSFNHYALGSVAQFLHKVVGGIAPLEPGWRKILVKPRPGGTITSASVSHVSPYGKVSCGWAIVRDTLKVEVQIPPNCSAVVDLPESPTAIVGSGQHTFSMAWQADKRFPPTVSRPHFLPPITNTFVP